MLEMGYIINSLEIRSLDDNKKYKIALPNQDDAMFKKFENLISEIRTFDLENYNQDNIENASIVFMRMRVIDLFIGEE